MKNRNTRSGIGIELKRQDALPMFFVIGAWVVLLINYHWGLISYRHLSVDTWIYLVLAFFALIGGYFIGWNFTPNPQSNRISESVYKIIVVLSFAGVLGLLFDWNKAGFSIIQTALDPLANRILQFEKPTSILTTISFPFAALTFTCFCITLLRLRRKLRDIWTYVSFISILGYLAGNVSQSGRGSFLMAIELVLGYMVVKYCCDKKNVAVIMKKVNILSIILGSAVVFLVLLYFVFIGGTRHWGTMTLERYIQEKNVDSDNILAKYVVNSVSEQTASGILSIMYYYSHQLSALDAVVTAKVPMTGYGANILEWPLKQLARTNIDFRDDYETVLNALEASGENMVGFQTGFPVLIADFGISGSIVAFLIFSVILGGLFKRATAGFSEVDQLASIWMFEGFLYGVQAFPGEGIHCVNAFLVIILLAFQRNGARPKNAID